MQDWEAIERCYGASMRRVVASYAAPGPRRAELGQEVALALWRALPSFRGESSERTFVLRIVPTCAFGMPCAGGS
ncbi:MAG: sigma-70 family RNA polymerase sigma factor [Deltaproteobacteria bacterium]|nr:MAG: sigma-70 family RNA polymerase sigma factor [Deltaproteobacteria bacterium]